MIGDSKSLPGVRRAPKKLWVFKVEVFLFCCEFTCERVGTSFVDSKWVIDKILKQIWKQLKTTHSFKNVYYLFLGCSASGEYTGSCMYIKAIWCLSPVQVFHLHCLAESARKLVERTADLSILCSKYALKSNSRISRRSIIESVAHAQRGWFLLFFDLFICARRSALTKESYTSTNWPTPELTQGEESLKNRP